MAMTRIWSEVRAWEKLDGGRSNKRGVQSDKIIDLRSHFIKIILEGLKKKVKGIRMEEEG